MFVLSGVLDQGRNAGVNAELNCVELVRGELVEYRQDQLDSLFPGLTAFDFTELGGECLDGGFGHDVHLKIVEPSGLCLSGGSIDKMRDLGKRFNSKSESERLLTASNAVCRRIQK